MTTTRTHASALVSIAVAMSLAACGGGSKSSAPAASRPSTTTDHRTNLSSGETASLAANLVPVPGYDYVDVSKSELDAELKRLQEYQKKNGIEGLFAGISLHSVVAHDPTQNTAHAGNAKETGFLQLYEFSEAPPAGVDQKLAEMTTGGVLIDRQEISGTSVFVLEDSASVDSRYHYSWLRHGVQGTIDGADRAPLEKWLRAYLATPMLLPSETGKLSAWLVPVPGYAYANYSDPALIDGFVTGPLGAVPYSLHEVTDAENTIGGLILAEVPSSLSTQQFVAALQSHGLAGYTTVGTPSLGGTSVEHLSSSSGDWTDAFVWTKDSIAGVFVTREPDKATQFLTALLAAPR